MEGGERSHPQRSGSSGSGAGEFFICFTSRLSSSSAASSASAAMRVPTSKAHVSPGRGRDPSSGSRPSSSLNHRLHSSGSIKGAQSPMFPHGVQLTGRKKGCAFEAAEPSSPKVTCIGQVRVRAKNKGKSQAKTAVARSRSWRAGGGGEASFRREERGRNQGWVHQLPLSICDALGAIGSDFNCFLPCGGRSICCGAGGSRAGEKKKRGKKRMARSGSSSSYGAVLARWLMVVQESEKAKGGDAMEEREAGIFLKEWEEKVAEADVEKERRGGEEGEIVVVGEKVEDGEEAVARMSVCIPPKNALLLMRCRSDPVRMAALANRLCGSPVTKPQCEEENVEEEIESHGNMQVIEKDDEKRLLKKEEIKAVEVSVKTGEMVNEEGGCEKSTEEEKETLMEEKLPLLKVDIIREELSCGSLLDGQVSPSKDEAIEETNAAQEEQENKDVRRSHSHQPVKEIQKEEEETKGWRVEKERIFWSTCASRSKERGMTKQRKEKDGRRHSFSSVSDASRHSFSSERETRRASFSVERGKWFSFTMEKEEFSPKEVKSIAISATVEGVESSGEAESEKVCCTEQTQATGEGKQEVDEEGVEEEKKELPECLLMMMYEPKLSMEVSKETLVCGNDFLNNHRPSKPDSGEVDETTEEVVAAVQPAAVLATQEKLEVAQFQPFVLTRCKSEPVCSSARLAPEACFWKDRHRPIGAAGVGF